MNILRRYLTNNSVIASIIFIILVSGFFVPGIYKAIWYNVIFGFVVVGSLPFIFTIISSLRRGIFGVDSIAILAIISALYTDEIIAAGIVLLMLAGGGALEAFAEKKARFSLERLLRRVPMKASVYKDGVFKIVRINDVRIGDILGIKKGEVIPVDGIVSKGYSTVDESVITGEPIPKEVAVGDKVISGSVSEGDFFQIEATSTYATSIFSGIVKLVNQAENEKAPMVRLADTYSVYFTVFTFVLAGAAFLKDPILGTAVLVVATPCPLILAAPIAFIAGMSKSARKGIIVKRGGVFETIRKASVFFFDKTGTLTLGSPSVYKVYSYVAGFSEKEILRYAASLEQTSTHILAESIVAKAKAEGIQLLPPSNIKEIIGEGVTGILQGREYIIGKLSFLEAHGVVVLDNDNEKQSKSRPAVYVARGGHYLGKIIFSDAIRRNAKDVIQDLFSFKKSIVLLTGDSDTRAHEIGKALGIRNIKANCLPEDKFELVRQYERRGKTVVMIGDGVNDAPSLGVASVGVALSSHGQTVATDIADVVIVANDIHKIVSLVEMSNDTVRIAKQSMLVGMGLSVIAMVFAYLGFLPPISGAILQEGIDILVIVNALRAL